MPKILKNYMYENSKLIICDFKGVFSDMPVAVCDFGKDYKEPVLLEFEDGSKAIVEKKEYEEMLKKQEDGKLAEEKKAKDEKKEIK